MVGQYLIAFRETLEAALIVAIILAYLHRTERRPLSRYVWYGVSTALVLALVLGLSLWLLFGGISESAQVLFEGGAALLAVAVLTWMIFWMATKGREIQTEIERSIASLTTRGTLLGLALFSFIAVFREGLETVLFLTPFLIDSTVPTLIGTALGIGSAIVLSYALFVLGMRISLGRFFYYTSILLVLIAGGLFGYGVHELIEYAELGGVELGWLGKYAYTLNIPPGSIFHHTGAVGSIFAVMLGYTVRAEWARLIVQVVYLAVFLPLIIRVYRHTSISSARVIEN